MLKNALIITIITIALWNCFHGMVVAGSAHAWAGDDAVILAQDSPETQKGSTPDAAPPAEPVRKTGLIQNSPDSFKGYTLLNPMMSSTTYLIDNEGRIVHQWNCDTPGMAAYLLPNGHLLRACSSGFGGNRTFRAGGATGRVQEFTWDGELVWDFEYSNDDYLLHHGIEPMPNGNVLMIAWERKTAQEAIAAGRSPDVQGEGDLWIDCIVEVKPTGKTTGEIVWEWHAWDHLIQDFDPSKANYGNIAEHPELIHINPIEWMENILPEDLEKLKALGYIGGSSGAEMDQDQPDGRGTPGFFDMRADFMHTNSLSYHPELDQIALSVLGFSEIWVIDHGATTQEAAGHSGGKRGKGGDLLYRWGNPMAYGAGSKIDQQLFSQHDVQWIPTGYPGAGNLLVFNNGRDRLDGNYSSIVEITPPLDQTGNYILEEGQPFGPNQPTWIYTAPYKTDFFSPFLSGVQRLDNGNTLVCSGMSGEIFEVDPEGEIVWKYQFPSTGPFPFGPGRGGRSPFEMFDTDKDGKISLNESKNLPFFREDLFKQFDKNNDGFLSEDELPDGPPPGMPGPGFPGPGFPGSDMRGPGRRGPDGNGVGMRGPGRGFPRPDRGNGPPPLGELLDSNRDGEVTLREATSLPFFNEDMFKQQDKNNDGILTGDEIPNTPPGFGGFGFGGPGMGGPGFGGPGGFGGGLFTVRRYAPEYAGLAKKKLTPGHTIEAEIEKRTQTDKG